MNPPVTSKQLQMLIMEHRNVLARLENLRLVLEEFERKQAQGVTKPNENLLFTSVGKNPTPVVEMGRVLEFQRPRR